MEYDPYDQSTDDEGAGAADDDEEYDDDSGGHGETGMQRRVALGFEARVHALAFSSLLF